MAGSRRLVIVACFLLIGTGFLAVLPTTQGQAPIIVGPSVPAPFDSTIETTPYYAKGYFTENLGQYDSSVAYVAITEFGKAIFYQSMVQYSLEKGGDGSAEGATQISLTFPGSCAISPVGQGAESHYSNFFLGDPSTWVTGARNFQSVVYQDLWPGIDLRFTFSDKGLKYEFHVDPYVNEEAIQVKVEGAEVIANPASLTFMTGQGCLVDRDLSITEGFASLPLVGSFVLSGDIYSFAIEGRDASKELLIDPLVFSTYMGGTGSDYANSIAVDSSGNVFVAGYTLSLDFPTSSPYQAAKDNLSDAFVLKLSSSGNSLIYSTFIGGNGDDVANAIAIDSSGNAYLAGRTSSTDFPTSVPLDSSNNGLEDAFAIKLSSSGGSLVYSTYIGGNGYDCANGIAVDASGYAFITGTTQSTDFPTHSPYQVSNRGLDDAFALRLGIYGDSLVYSTYIGGSAEDYANGIALDSSGNAYIVGGTLSTDFPTSSPYQGSNRGFEDAYLLKLDASGGFLAYSTYLGGGADDVANALVVGPQGEAYVTGTTASTNFPTSAPFQSSNAGSDDAFVLKVNANGNGLVYSTYIGGSSNDLAFGIALDANGLASITGRTFSTNFPVYNAHQPNKAGSLDAFLLKLALSGVSLVYSTYLGGSGSDTAYDIAVDASNYAYVCGYTASTNFPTSNPYQGANEGSTDAFILKVGQPSLPTMVQGLTATAGMSQVTLSWQAPASNGGSPISKYRIYRGTSPGNEAYLTFVGNVLAFTDHDVAHQSYYYRVAAENLVGEGPLSAEAGPATPITKPSPPRSLTAKPGDEYVSLNWSAPIDDGGQPITNYSIYRGTSSGGEAYLITVGNVLTYNNTGLSNGQAYYYMVTAINSVGQSPISNEAHATPLVIPTVPSAPQGLTATPSNGQVELTWSTPNRNGHSAITNYRIYRGTSSGGETLLITVGNQSTYTDTGLINGQIYYYKVSAVNSIGEGAWSNEVFATPLAVPSAPQSLIAYPEDAKIILVWSAPSSNGGSPVSNYWVYRGTISGGEILITTLGDVLTYTDTPLTNGQVYYYRISAVNIMGEGPPSDEAFATPIGKPTAPLSLTATRGNAQVTLSWSVPLNSGGSPIFGYTVYRGESSGGETFLVTLGNILTFVDTGLTNGQTYYYAVTATNSVGEGSRSNEDSATPATFPSAPQDLTAASGNAEVILTWSAPSSNGGSPITGYKIHRGLASGNEIPIATLANVLSFADTGLDNGLTYYYTVSAFNAVGEGSQSSEASAVPATIPSSPTITSVTPGNAQVVLVWTAPTNDGGSPIIGYNLYRGEAPGGEALLASLGTVLTYKDTGLTNGQIYFYKLRAVNGAGEGEPSNEASATPVTIPQAPQGLAALAGQAQVSLTWSAPPSDGGSAITGYKVYRGMSPGTEVPHITLGVVLTYTDSSLVNGQTYFYKVSAVNKAGEGPLSLEAFATPATVPSAPRGLQSAAGDGFVYLNWTAPSYSGPGTLTYHLFRNGVLVWTGVELERTDGGLSNGVTYTYKVAAQNSVGRGENSSQVQAMPKAIETVPTSPRGLTGVPGDQKVDLNWTSPYYIGPTPITYHLFRDGVMIWSGAATSYHDAPLTKGVQYSYKVAAQNSIGWGPNCTAVLTVPNGVPDAPYGLVAIAGDSKISLAWTSVNYSGPGTLTYHLFRDGDGIWSGTTDYHNDTGLSNGQIHTYKVAASNSLGWSLNSSSVSATAQGPPTAPRGLSAFGSDGLVVLNWTAPSYAGPGTLTYHLFRDGTETWSGTANSRIDLNLKNGQSYAYMVAASNSIDMSPNSAIVIATPQGPPTPPGGLTARSGSELVELNWTAPSYPGPGVLTYHLIRDGVEVWNGISTSHVDAGLSNGHAYLYRLAASNSIGWSEFSSNVSATPQGPPGVPRGLVATAGNGFVELNWTAPSYPGPGLLTYHIFRDGSLLWSGYGMAHTDSTVTNGVTYSYSVSAQNSMGWGLNSSEAAATPLSVDTVPSAPTGLVASPGVLLVDLSWTEPSYLGPGATTYHLYRDGVMIWSDALTSYRDAPLVKGVQHLYTVAASNSMGWGANSSSVLATPIGVPDAPWGLSIVSGNAQASLSWNPGNYSGPGTIVYHAFRDGVEVWNGTTTYHTDPGLVNGQTYTYAIATSNLIGWSANSSSLSMAPQGPPSSPRGLTAQAGNELVELIWTSPEYEGTGSLVYHLFRNGALVWSGSDLARIDGGLANFVTYSYKVAAQNAVGWGPNSTIVQAMPLSDEMTPSAPRDLAIMAGNENITLAWDAPGYSNASTVVGYAIYFGINPSSMPNLITWNQLTYVLEGLNKGQEYYFRVAAQNNAGWGLNSTMAMGIPYGVPSSPTGPSVEAGDSFVRLSWGAPSYLGPGTITYHLFRDGSLIWSGGGSSYNDTSLANGRTYSYQVAAQNDAGRGPNSSSATATPSEIIVPIPPGVPNGLQIVVGDGQTTLTWNVPDQSGSSEVVEYHIYRGISPDAILILINVTSTTYVDTGLVNGQTYYYKVSAVSEAGEGASTESVSAIPISDSPGGQDMTMTIFILVIVAIAATVAVILALRRKGG